MGNVAGSKSQAKDDAEHRLGRIVRALRQQARLSQKQLATQMTELAQQRPNRGPNRFTQAMIAKLEAGDRPISLNEATDLASIFGMSLEVMLAAEQEPALAEEASRLQDTLAGLTDLINERERDRIRVRDRLEYVRGQLQFAAMARRQGVEPDETAGESR